MKKDKRLLDIYTFPGFLPSETVKGLFGDSYARIIELHREGKKRSVASAVPPMIPSMITRPGWSAIYPAETCGSIWRWKSVGLIVRSAAK